MCNCCFINNAFFYLSSIFQWTLFFVFTTTIIILVCFFMKLPPYARTYLQLPLQQWGAGKKLKGKHCRKPHCRNGVVDTFGSRGGGNFHINLRNNLESWIRYVVFLTGYWPHSTYLEEKLSTMTTSLSFHIKYSKPPFSYSGLILLTWRRSCQPWPHSSGIRF